MIVPSIEQLSALALEQAATYDAQRSQDMAGVLSGRCKDEITRLTNTTALAYAVLHRTAIAGKPSPSDRDLAVELRLSNHKNIWKVIATLKRRGLIKVRGHRGRGREIWIVAGKLFLPTSKALLVPGVEPMNPPPPPAQRFVIRRPTKPSPPPPAKPKHELTVVPSAPNPFALYEEWRDGPHRLWPVVAFLRNQGERIAWQRGRYIAGGGYGRLSPADLVRRANVICESQGRALFPVAIADRVVAA